MPLQTLVSYSCNAHSHSIIILRLFYYKSVSITQSLSLRLQRMLLKLGCEEERISRKGVKDGGESINMKKKGQVLDREAKSLQIGTCE